MKNTVILRAHHTTLHFCLLTLFSGFAGSLAPVLYAQPISGLEIVRSLRHPQNYEVQEFDTWFDSTHQRVAYTRVSGSPGGDTLVIYDVVADAVLGEVTGAGRSTDVRFVAPDQLLFLRADTIFRITGFPDSISVAPLIGLPYIYGFDLSPDVSQLALTRVSYEPDETWQVRLYDFDRDSGMVSGPVLTFPLSDRLRFSESKLAYSRDGNFLAVNGGYEKNYVFLLDVFTPAVFRVDLPDNGGTYSPVFFRREDVLKLALGGGFTDGAISVIDLPSLSFEEEFPAFMHYNYGLDVDPAEDFLVAGGYDWLIKIFQLTNAGMTEVFALDSGFVRRVAFTADGEHIVSAHGVSDGARLNIFRILRETVGEEVIHASPVGLFPNPVTDNLWINESFGADVTVFDMQGRIVLRRVYDGMPLDVAALPEGMYILKSVCDGRVATGQFVKVGR